jgi:membrane protein DedA with SNARE-associated domain
LFPFALTSSTVSDPSLLQHYLYAARPYLEQYGYTALFAGVFVEGFGIPAPGETLVVASALLAAQGGLHIVYVLLVAWVAAVLGDNIGYAIGHFGGRRLVLRHGRFVGIREHHLEKVERFFHRYGGVLVAAARFFEVLRQLNGVVAGTSGMPWWRFLLYNAIGAALWIGLWGYGVYRLGHHMDRLLDLFSRFEPYVIGAGVVAAAGLVVYLFHRQRT